ncbi:hypothetical protein CIB48_g10864 [Xylaria polymorpha]|nr:hypothetical protein CIB48_g10864 [Xylaria polymorpha]
MSVRSELDVKVSTPANADDLSAPYNIARHDELPAVAVLELYGRRAAVDAGDVDLGAFVPFVEPAPDADGRGVVGTAEFHGLVPVVAHDDVEGLAVGLEDPLEIQDHLGWR